VRCGYHQTVEPIPETIEAVEEFGPFSADPDEDLLDVLRERAASVERLVPSLVGLSVASLAEGVTFTLAASDDVPAVLDGLQYLSDGPCLHAAAEGAPAEHDREGLFAEEGWRLFALGAADAGVHSTLTLPVLEDGEVMGSVNLYASEPRAFDGLHDQIAEVFGAWAAGATRNADLSFETRREAQAAPARLRGSVLVLVATGIIARSRAIDGDTARDHLLAAASLAGVSVEDLAATVVSSTTSVRGRRNGQGRRPG
jgi:GAF domain-containing protein